MVHSENVLEKTPRATSSFECVTKYLVTDSGGYKLTINLRAVIAEWLNASQISRAGVGMNKSARGEV